MTYNVEANYRRIIQHARFTVNQRANNPCSAAPILEPEIADTEILEQASASSFETETPYQAANRILKAIGLIS